MIRYLASLVCRWKGHRWSKPHAGVIDAFDQPMYWAKVCRRCARTATVKRRQPKVSPVAEQLTGALARNFGQNKDAL